MSRIDVQTLVMAFEKRIEALEKNPPDKVPMSVIINLLEKAVDDEIRNHFTFLIKKEVQMHLQGEFKKIKAPYIKQVVKNILSDPKFKEDLENKIKRKIISSIPEY